MEASGNSDEITFDEFKEILFTFNKFNRNIIIQNVDKIRKKVKEGLSSQIEGDLYLNKNDYFEFIEQICMEHDKLQNEKDPELKYLFNLLTNEEATLNKKKLIEIIREFDLPVDFEEFFSPIRSKEEIAFTDFCSLFKSKSGDNDIFFKTFASSFYNLRSTEYENNNKVFPIEVQRK